MEQEYDQSLAAEVCLSFTYYCTLPFADGVRISCLLWQPPPRRRTPPAFLRRSGHISIRQTRRHLDTQCPNPTWRRVSVDSTTTLQHASSFPESIWMHSRKTLTGTLVTCPVFSHLLLTDSRVISNFKKGGLDWQLTAEEYPTFLYDEREGWSEQDIKKGLLRGHVLVRVSRLSHLLHSIPYNLPTFRLPSVYSGMKPLPMPIALTSGSMEQNFPTFVRVY